MTSARLPRGRQAPRLLEGARLAKLEELDFDAHVHLDALDFPALRRLSLRHASADADALLALLERCGRLDAVEIVELDGLDRDEAYAAALELRADHPLRAVLLGGGVPRDEGLRARVAARYSPSFYG